jgi:hypothetical protein
MKSDIRCLAVRQPYAWAIMAGAKDIENRSWTTDYRGPIVLQASSCEDGGEPPRESREADVTRLQLQRFARHGRSVDLDVAMSSRCPRVSRGTRGRGDRIADSGGEQLIGSDERVCDWRVVDTRIERAGRAQNAQPCRCYSVLAALSS